MQHILKLRPLYFSSKYKQELCSRSRFKCQPLLAQVLSKNLHVLLTQGPVRMLESCAGCGAVVQRADLPCISQDVHCSRPLLDRCPLHSSSHCDDQKHPESSKVDFETGFFFPWKLFSLSEEGDCSALLHLPNTAQH